MKKGIFLFVFVALLLSGTIFLCRTRPLAEEKNAAAAKRKILLRWIDDMRREYFADRFRETELIAEKIILNFPEEPSACRMQTKICFLRKEWDAGEALSRKFLQRFPEDPGILNNLAVLLFARGKREEAVSLLSLSCHYAPDHPVLVHNSRAVSRLLGKSMPENLPLPDVKDEDFPEWIQILIFGERAPVEKIALHRRSRHE